MVLENFGSWMGFLNSGQFTTTVWYSPNSPHTSIPKASKSAIRLVSIFRPKKFVPSTVLQETIIASIPASSISSRSFFRLYCHKGRSALRSASWHTFSSHCRWSSRSISPKTTPVAAYWFLRFFRFWIKSFSYVSQLLGHVCKGTPRASAYCFRREGGSPCDREIFPFSLSILKSTWSWCPSFEVLFRA